jgi:O-antigen/teichoic acid export membrane protein
MIYNSNIPKLYAWVILQGRKCRLFGKVKALLANEGAMFFISNLVYSFSTYLIALLIPYKLNIETMAGFSAAFNIVMMLIFVFEFGLTVSYLRFNQIYKISDQINAMIQLLIFVLLFILSQTALGHYADLFFGVQNLGIAQSYIYLSIFALLSWIFFKTTLLAKKRIKFIIVNSFIILGIRIAFLLYILLWAGEIDLDLIYLDLFIFPFVMVIALNMKYNISFLLACKEKIFHKEFQHLFIRRLKQFIVFSALTYIINGLFIYTNRYAIIYLVDEKLTTTLAELGYAMSFGGLIMIFISSLRSYFLSKFSMSEMDAVLSHIRRLKRYKWYVLLGGMVVAALFAGIVYAIKPDYLSVDSPIYVFILIFSSILIAYMSLFSLLSKTFNFNMLELKLNAIRLALVVLLVQALFTDHPIVGFAAVNMVIVGVEFYFARIVLRRIYRKERAGEKSETV